MAQDDDELKENLVYIEAFVADAGTMLGASAANSPERTALLQRWNEQIGSACAAIGKIDEDALYEAARTAALHGPRAAPMSYIRLPPMSPFSVARRPDLWNDWADTAPRLLNGLADRGDAEALFIRGLALGYDTATIEGLGGGWDFIIGAMPNDAARAYRDFRAYLAHADAPFREHVNLLLPELAARVDAAQRAAIDAEFGAR